jgi:hypothetical protein
MNVNQIKFFAVIYATVGTIAIFFIANALSKLNRYVQIGCFFALVIIGSIFKENGQSGIGLLFHGSASLLLIQAVTKRMVGKLSFATSSKNSICGDCGGEGANYLIDHISVCRKCREKRTGERGRMYKAIKSVFNFVSEHVRVIVGIFFVSVGITARAYYSEGNSVDFGYFLGWLALLGGMAILIKPLMKAGLSAWIEAQKAASKSDAT